MSVIDGSASQGQAGGANGSAQKAAEKDDSNNNNNSSSSSSLKLAVPEKITSDAASDKPSFDKSNHETTTGHFTGDLETNNTLPTREVLQKTETYQVLDEDGKTHTFKSLYTGPNVARRVLVIFVRHFFCGNCQEYLRTLSSSVTADDLLSLPVPTFVAVIGCGTPSLIPMYRETTNCPFPIYADPSRKLYDDLGMTKTLALGSKPEYQRKNLLNVMVQSFVQEMRALTSGRMLKGGNYSQVGGEFLFEPLEGKMNATSLVMPRSRNDDGHETVLSAHDRQGGGEMADEEKRVTWCHRMRNTRDHADMPELREVLGLAAEEDVDGAGKASVARKGTGESALARENGNMGQAVNVH